MSPDVADAMRDALAVAAAGLAGDEEAAAAIVVNADAPLMIGGLCALLFEALRDQGTDPAEWIEQRQARLRGEAGG